MKRLPETLRENRRRVQKLGTTRPCVRLTTDEIDVYSTCLIVFKQADTHIHTHFLPSKGWVEYEDMENYILVEQWLGFLRNHGRKEITIDGYRLKIMRCLKILNENGRPTDPRMITAADMILLNRSLGICESSRKDYLKRISDWVQWYTGEDLMRKSDILWNRTKPRRVFIGNDEFSRLMEFADERDRVILLLGGAMGIRRDEMRNLKYSDIENGRLYIHGKGHGDAGKEDDLKIPPLVMSAIDEWTRIRESNGMEDLSGGCIIVSYQKAGMKQMANSSLSHHVRELGRRAGVRVTVHSLRRLFATSLYRNHVDIVDIKNLMRHANVRTTIDCYIDPDGERLDGIMGDMGMILNISETHDEYRHYEKRETSRV